MTLLKTPVCDFGKPADDFSLPGTDGKIWTLNDCRGDNGLLIMFICNHCPYVKAIRERLIKDTRQLREYGINTVAIMSNNPEVYPEDSFESMKAIAEECQFPFPYLFDETQETAKLYGAVCTPDFFGYNKNLELQFRGRLDEGVLEPPPEGSPRELCAAMKLIAETGEGPKEQIPSQGCSIKWRGE